MIPSEYSEYLPSRSQCQAYTAAPLTAAPSRSLTTRENSSGTPSAVPLEPPNEVRMSLRTMPDSVRTSGPFEPSAGYGPAVSDATSVAVPAAALAAVPADADVPAVSVVLPQAAVPPTSARAPAPPKAASSRRRDMVRRSNRSPLSCTRRTYAALS